MTQNEFRQLIAYLRTAYPHYKQFQDRDACNAWWMTVKDYPASDMMAAAAEHARTKNFPPTYRELTAGLAPVKKRRRLVGEIATGKHPCELAHRYDGEIVKVLKEHYPVDCGECQRLLTPRCWAVQMGVDHGS